MKVVVVLALITMASAVSKFPISAISDTNYIDSAPRVFLGREATPHSMPYQVLVYTGHYYTGALISQNYVLTGASFLYGKDSVDLILGAHNRTYIEDTQVRMTSTEILLHPDYKDYMNNNVAIVRLPLSVRLTSTIRPIPLPSLNDDISKDYSGALATSGSWRTTDANGTHFVHDVLSYVQVKVISNSECSVIYNNINSRVLCVTGEGNMCSGDSGSPLVTNGVLIGIFTFMSSTCPDSSPAGFTRVTSVLPWILQNTDA